MTKLLNPLILLFITFLLASIFRFYNINFDDLWIDEIATFWIANPSFDLLTSYKNHIGFERTPYLFNYIIKIFFTVFGYNIELARLIPAFTSIFSILIIAKISRSISKNSEYFLSAFIISFNIFLISYSQELRVYSTQFFFISLSLFYFIKLDDFKNLINYSLFFLFTQISMFLHPFSLILLFSYFTLFVLDFIKKEKLNFKLIFLNIVILIISAIYYGYHSYLSMDVPTWITQPNLKFYTNFYFSKFFGSRIMGLFFLITLLLLIIKFYKQIIKNKVLTLLTIFIIYSYFFPLFYGYIFQPIILPRYITFVLIPIILLISNLTFKLKYTYKYILVSAIVIFTLLNFVTEETFRQFFTDRKVYKPEFNRTLNIIENSNEKNLLLLLNPAEQKLESSWEKSTLNYLEYLKQKKSYSISFINKNKSEHQTYWILCIYDLNQNICKLKNNLSINNEIFLNRGKLILVEKISQ